MHSSNRVLIPLFDACTCECVQHWSHWPTLQLCTAGDFIRNLVLSCFYAAGKINISDDILFCSSRDKRAGWSYQADCQMKPRACWSVSSYVTYFKLITNFSFEARLGFKTRLYNVMYWSHSTTSEHLGKLRKENDQVYFKSYLWRKLSVSKSISFDQQK